MDAWSTEDGDFKIAEFYDHIVQLFDEPDDPWVVDTLAWWNMWVSYLIVQTLLIHCPLGMSSELAVAQRRHAPRTHPPTLAPILPGLLLNGRHGLNASGLREIPWLLPPLS
jgi:hypothetical protein